MSVFSELLEVYISRLGISEKQLAEICGFSRSYIARLRNGQRMSPNVEKMERLFDTLKLSQREYEEIWNLYMEERQGEEKSNLIRNALGFVSGFRSAFRLSSDMKIDYTIPDIHVIEGREDVSYMVKLIIEQEAARQEGMLRLIIQPECGVVMEILKNAFKINRNFCVEHLVCLDNYTERTGDKYYNIGLLEKIMPVVLCGQNINYNVHYYYDKVTSHFNDFSLMPYLVLTEDRVIQIDYAFEHAVVYQEKEIWENFLKKFEVMWENRFPLYDLAINEKSLLIQNNVYVAGNIPCMSNERKVVSYFTKTGICQFMETGKIGDLSGRVCQLLEPKERHNMIRKIIEMTKRGLYEPRLIREERYQWPRELTIRLYNYENMALCYELENEGNTVWLKEKSTVRLFYHFLESFGDSPYVTSVEETLKYLEQYAI